MSYKIEIYYDGRKAKHKLYDTEKTYNSYWKYHLDFQKSWQNVLNPGLVGLIDGKVDKIYGTVPEKYCPISVDGDTAVS